MRRLIPFLAVGVVLLAGCRAEINVGMDVESTGAGTVASRSASTTSCCRSSRAAVAASTTWSARYRGAPPPWSRARRATSPSTGSPGHSPRRTSSNTLLAEGIQGIEAEGTELELTVDDGGATLDATIAIPDATEQAGELGDIGGSLGEFLSASFRAHLPGEVVERNADSVLDDGTLVWDLPVTGGTVDVFARSESGGGFPVMPVVIGIALIAAGGVAIYLLSRRSKGEGAAAIAATPEPAEPTPVFGAPEPATEVEDPIADGDRPDEAT